MPRKSNEALEQEAQDKDREISRLTAENKTLRDGIVELKKIYSEEGGDGGLDRSDGLAGLAAYIWRRPEGRSCLLTTIILLRMWLYRNAEHFWPENILCGGSALVLFCQWNEQEYRDSGIVQLLMKWGVFGSGVYATWNTFFNGDSNSLWEAAFVLVLTALLTISKFTKHLAEKVELICDRLMRIPIFAWAKGWLL